MSLERLGGWFGHWGYLGIFVAVLLGNVGFPVPEESIILLLGYLAWRGMFSLPGAIAVGIASAIVGDNLSYWVGREGGRPLLLRYGRYILLSPKKLQRAEEFFARHGRWAVFLGRFVAGIRFLAGPLAGISRMPFWEFFACNAAGAVVYVTAVILVGYAAGPHLHAVLRTLERAEHFVALGAALLVAGLAWRFRAGRRREGHGAGAHGDPRGVRAMVAAAELRAGMVVDLEGVRYRVMAAETHLGGGKAGAMVHARLGRLDTGSVTERRFRPDEKLADQPLDLRELDFLYQDGDDCIFMDPESFDQFPLPRALLGTFAPFLREGMRLQVDFVGEQAAAVRVPETVDLKVASTGEAQHAKETSALKAAKLENGMTIQVPLFIRTGEMVRVNVATGRYVERVREKKG